MVRVRVGRDTTNRGAGLLVVGEAIVRFTFGEVVRRVGDAVYKTIAFWRGVRREWTMVSIGPEA